MRGVAFFLMFGFLLTGCQASSPAHRGEVRRHLNEALEAATPEAKRDGIRGAEQISGKPWVELLMEAARSPRSARTGFLAARELLIDPRESIRACGVDVLSRYPTGESCRLLADILRDDRAAVGLQLLAVRSLGRIDLPIARSCLELALESVNPVIRGETERILEKLGYRRARASAMRDPQENEPSVSDGSRNGGGT